MAWALLLYQQYSKLKGIFMENDLLHNLRTVIIIFTLSSTILNLPELSPASFRPLFLLWLRLRQRLHDLRTVSISRKRERFWEIDMTKLEP